MAGNSLSARQQIEDFRSALAARSRSEVNRTASVMLAAGLSLGGQWRGVASALQHNGEFALAYQALQLLLEQTSRDPQAVIQIALLLARFGRHEKAREMLDTLPPELTQTTEIAYFSGTLAMNMGDVSAAETHLRNAIANNPGSGQSWLALTTLITPTAADHQALEQLSNRAGRLSAIDRGTLFYALGRAREKFSSPELIFSAYTQGGQIMSELRQYDPSIDRQNAAQATSGWTTDSIADLMSRQSGAKRKTIFVTGLPRSGTTLVEQILASHPQVSGGEELGIAAVCASEIGGSSAMLLERWNAQGHSSDELSELYYHLLDQRVPGSEAAVDKSIDSTRYLGLLAAILPQSRIIWVRRSPLDCAWSAYRTFSSKARTGVGHSLTLPLISTLKTNFCRTGELCWENVSWSWTMNSSCRIRSRQSNVSCTMPDCLSNQPRSIRTSQSVRSQLRAQCKSASQFRPKRSEQRLHSNNL